MKKIYLTIILLANPTFAEDIQQDAPHNWQRLGYTESKISDGIYDIHFGAPRLLFSAKPSWDGWNRRAKLLCGDSSYRVLKKEQNLTGSTSDPSGQIFQVRGYAICESTGLDDSTAEKIINEYLNPPVVVDEKIIADCSNNKISDKEKAYEETDKLASNQRYAEALPCLLNIVSTNDNEYINKKAYSQLGVMYEVGLGVSIDKEKAMSYYQKSGF